MTKKSMTRYQEEPPVKKKSKVMLITLIILSPVLISVLIGGFAALVALMVFVLPVLLLMSSVALPIVLAMSAVSLVGFILVGSVALAGFLLMAWVFFDWIVYMFIGRLYGARMIDWVRQEFPRFQPRFDRFLSVCNRHTKKTVFILVPVLSVAIGWALPYCRNAHAAFLLLVLYWCAYFIRSFFIMLLGVKRMPLPAFIIFYYISFWVIGMIGSWAALTMCPVVRQDFWLVMHGFLCSLIG